MTDWVQYAKDLRKKKQEWCHQVALRTEAKKNKKAFMERVAKRVEMELKHCKRDRFFPYRERDAVLKAIGFPSYRAYLASDLWKEIRTKVMESYGWQCGVCRAKATEIHHRNYLLQTLSGKEIGGMVAVCRRCHENAEYEQGEKNGLHAANRKIKNSRTDLKRQRRNERKRLRAKQNRYKSADLAILPQKKETP